MDEKQYREITAVIESDLKTCGATTPADMKEAALASVSTLFPPSVKVALYRDPKNPETLRITVIGRLD